MTDLQKQIEELEKVAGHEFRFNGGEIGRIGETFSIIKQQQEIIKIQQEAMEGAILNSEEYKRFPEIAIKYSVKIIQKTLGRVKQLQEEIKQLKEKQNDK